MPALRHQAISQNGTLRFLADIGYCRSSLMCVAEGFRAALFIFGGAALVYWLLYPASGQELHQHTHDGDVGHFYQTWMRPGNTARGVGHRQYSCCNEKDCYATSFKFVGGTWFAQRREDGEWMP